MSFSDIFCVSTEELNKISLFYDKSEENIKLMVNSLKKWIQTQPHIPQDQDDYFLEMMLKLNKFNEEKTQKKIDMYYAMRNIVPEFYRNRSAHCDDMKLFLDTFMVVPLPNLTSSMERVYLVKFLDTNPANFDLITNAKYLFSVFDIRIRNDPAIGERYIYDLAGLRLGHVLKVNPMTIQKIYSTMEKGYSDKIKGIHFLNMPMIGNALINVAKLVLSEKLCNRVYSHKSLESLFDFIPKQLLPADYNGDQKHSEQLYETWRSAFEESSIWLEQMAQKKTNEDLRIESENCSSNIGYFRLFASTK